MSDLSVFLHGLARAFTLPHAQRDKINAALVANPGALAAVNQIKDGLIMSLVHASVDKNSDPLAAALAAVVIAQQVERMIPTPANVPAGPPEAHSLPAVDPLAPVAP